MPNLSPPAHRDIDPAGIRREQLRLLFDVLPSALTASLVNTLLLSWVLYPITDSFLLLGWLSASLAISAYRFYLLRRFRPIADSDFEPSACSRAFFTGTLLAGMSWGFAGYVLFPQESGVHQIFVAFVIAGMTAGAAVTLAPMWRMAAACMLPSVSLVVLRLLSLDWEVAPVMALMGLLFLATAMLIARRSYLFTLESIRIRFSRKETIAALAESNERTRRLLEGTADGIFGIDSDGVTSFVNPSATRMLGYSAEELVGKNNHAMIHHSHADGRPYPKDECRMLAPLIDGLPQQVDDEVLWRKDGSSFPAEYSATPLFSGDEVVGAVISFRDISERRHTDEALRLAATAFEAHEAIAITDLQGNILRINQAFTDITGYAEEEVLGHNPSILQSGRHGADFYEELWRTLNLSGHWEGEIWNRRKSGEVYPEWLSITAVRDEGGAVTHYIAHFQDITERKQAEAHIEYQAYFDALTELPNRRMLLERMEQEISRSRRHGHYGAVLFLDLDRFKTINDSLGHAVGDALLKEVAARIRRTLREEDMAARLGGDEFVVLLSELGDDPEHAAEAGREVAEKLRGVLAGNYDLEGRRLHTSPSIGIALFPLGDEGASDLLKQADIAMYRAKEQGRNAVHFYLPSMELDADERLILETDLRRALGEGGEMTLYYQPQLQSDGRLVGAEALVRWRHPQRGMLGPGEFLPVAEASGLLGELGEWVLGEACRALSRWQTEGLNVFPLAVNISPIQLQQENFVERVEQSLRESGADPQRLELEITEEMLLREQEKSIAKMHALRRDGVRFSIDDFGTGYSSLAYLRRLPATTLKIDRTFVTDVHVNANDAAIAETIISMGRHLEMMVLAEGVENAEQLSFLAERGCEVFQGYYFSRPLEESAFLAYAREHL